MNLRADLPKDLFNWLFATLIFVLPFSAAIPNVLLAVALLAFLVSFRRSDLNKVKQSPFLLFNLFVLYLVIKSVINGDLLSDLKYFSVYLIICLVPVLISKVDNILLLKRTALVSINLTISISIVQIFIFHNKFGYFPFTHGWAVNWVLWLERPYAGIFSILSIILSLDLLVNTKKHRSWYAASLFVSVLFIFFMSARMSMLTCIIGGTIYILFYLKRPIFQRAIFFAVILLTIVIAAFNSRNITKRFFIKDSVSQTIQGAKAEEPRVVIWSCAYKMAGSDEFNLLSGLASYSDIKNSFNECFGTIEDQSKRDFFINNGFNAHNQFIDFFLIGGLLGISLFTAFLIALIMYVRQNFFALSIVLAFILFLLVENVFFRQFGAYLFSIFVALYITQKRLVNEEN